MPLSPPNQAIEEIKAILRKHNLAGFAIVQGPDELAFLREIDPSWSCAFWELCSNGDLALRVRAKQAEYPNREAWHKAVDGTVGMLLAFANQFERDLKILNELIVALAHHFPEIVHIERAN